MSDGILGIHHVTALAGDPATNVDFYTRVLGLRMVKRTVNFDDPGTWHLYYGDETGSPGTILTFFPWPGARRGSRGTGQATVTAWSVPAGALGFWRERLAAHGVVHDDPARRLDEEEVLTFLDPDGLKLELVAHADAAGTPWRGGGIDGEVAIRSFHSVTLAEREPAETAALLAAMGYEEAGREGPRTRFALPGDGPGRRVDLLHLPGEGPGRIAAGTVHHVAFRVADDERQAAWRRRLVERGLHVTPVQDRQYFHSIYFREPGGVLFEVATDPPGFAIDEPVERLGEALRLPPWYEAHRAEIERALPPLAHPAASELGELGEVGA